MAADSSLKSDNYCGQVVCPENVCDKTLIESVAGLIQDVAPLAYPSTFGGFDAKDSIQWVKFDNNYSEENVSDDYGISDGLLLIIGYQSGVQIFSILPNGNAQEIFNWRSGSVKTLQILPKPINTDDLYQAKRPLIIICDDSGCGPPFTSVTIVSLKTGEKIKTIKFKSPVSEILCNKSVIVCTFVEKIAVFDGCTLEDKFTVTCCYPNPSCNPVALGSRWLAFSDNQLNVNCQSAGGVMSGVCSYTTSMFNAARSLTKGIKELSESVANSLTGSRNSHNSSQVSSNQVVTGLITVLDIEEVPNGEIRVQETTPGIIAHFMAHTSHPIHFIMFDPSGVLLFSADKLGNSFHVFKIYPHAGGSCFAAVHHLYVLHRGDTTARIQNVAFSTDSRWIAVCTSRGTTHVFPLTPYGGPINKRTHTSPKVVNRLSTFHRSAGLDESNIQIESSNLSSSPVQSRIFDCMLSCPYPNPRLVNSPPPIIVNSVVRIRKPFSTLTGGTNPIHKNTCQRSTRNISGDDVNALKVAAAFSSTRAFSLNTSLIQKEKKEKIVIGALFIMTSEGYMLEYNLEPRVDSTIPKEKVGEDSPIEVPTRLLAQWNFTCPKFTNELQCPVPLCNMNLLKQSKPCFLSTKTRYSNEKDDDAWLAQVEIETHCGPYRRLWMGPQFVFKTYNDSSVITDNLMELHGCDYPRKSKPVKMPSGYSASTNLDSACLKICDQSPRYAEFCDEQSHSDGSESDIMEDKIEENIADAMKDSSVEFKSEGMGTHQIIFPNDKNSQESIEEIFPLAVVSLNRSSSRKLDNSKDSEMSIFAFKSSDCVSPSESYLTCPSSQLHGHSLGKENPLDEIDHFVEKTLPPQNISFIDDSSMVDSVYHQTNTSLHDARKQNKKKNKKRRK